MSKLYAVKMADGGVKIADVQDGYTIEHVVERIKTALLDGEEVVSYREIKPEHRLTDRSFRAAWTDDLPTPGIDVDMIKARKIHMERIREMRDKELSKLDIETMRGKNVQAEKQVLRDLPQTIDLSVAQSPEQLKQLWPAQLKEKHEVYK